MNGIRAEGVHMTREECGLEPREPTPVEKYEERKAYLEGIVAKHPKCVWARNELKFLSVNDFVEPGRRRPLVSEMGSRGVCDAAVAAEIRYNGTGGFFGN